MSGKAEVKICLCNIETPSSLSIDVEEVVLPACISKKCYLEKIFIFLKMNDFLKKISICDDYLDPNSSEVKYFFRRLSEEFPGLRVVWIRELKIDGRHGG
jgi:hypothetical protein